MTLRDVHVGCSDWNYRDWRGTVYPPGVPTSRWLERYAELFDTVEVNSTFYRLASRDAVARWVEQTPPGFVLTVKASRYLTHMKKLRDIDEGVARFYERIETLMEAGRRGPVLWQLSEWFTRNDDLLAEVIARLPPGRHAWEFRDPSWFCEEVYAILRLYGAALVYGDTPQRPFQRHVRTADWGFVRFHYGARGRRGNYSPTELAEWAVRLHEWRRAEELWIYFNNDWSAFAVRNALKLRRELARRAAGA